LNWKCSAGIDVGVIIMHLYCMDFLNKAANYSNQTKLLIMDLL